VHDELPVYGSGGPFTMSLPELVAQAADTRRCGLRGFKMRVNFFRYQPDVEAERVAAVREALGRDMALAIDAVQNYNSRPWSVKQAARMLRMLEPFDLTWAEEMLPPFDPPALHRAAACDGNTDLGRRGHHHGCTVRAVASSRGLRPGTARRDDHRWNRRGATGCARPPLHSAFRWRSTSGDRRRRSLPTSRWPSPRPTASGSNNPCSVTRSSPSCSSSPLSSARAMCGRRRPRDSASAYCRAPREVSVRAGQRQRVRRVGPSLRRITVAARGRLPHACGAFQCTALQR
jgi:enolase-like protein